tara:strand:- start:1018 stop:1434 length:417 start_codon:yes stop_codon:yes gene_type:complete
MAKFVATDISTSLNGTDLSASIAQVELSITGDEVETTSFGTANAGWRTYTGGLKQASVTLQFHQDFGASGIDSVLWPLLNTNGTFIILPTSGTVSATNPSYSFEALISQYSPIASSVGDLASFSVTFPVVGEITRATA